MDITVITTLGSGFQWLFWFVDFHDLVNLVLTPKPEKTEPLTSLTAEESSAASTCCGCLEASNGWRAVQSGEPNQGSSRGNALDPEGWKATSPYRAMICK